MCKSAGQGGPGCLSAPFFFWVGPIETHLGHHADGQKVPTLFHYNSDKALWDDALDLDPALILKPDVASEDAVTPYLDVWLRS